MKKIFIAAFILSACNQPDDLEKAKKNISIIVPQFLIQATKSRLLINESTLYHLDKINEKDAIDFRIQALSDSVIIQNNLTETYKRNIEKREKDMKDFDSMKVSTVEIKKRISRYNYQADSVNTALANTKKTLDSLSGIKLTDTKNRNFYNASFRICSFNIITSTSCDSVAFLLDKKLNVISMHIIR